MPNSPNSTGAEPDWARLGRYIVRRRAELGMRSGRELVDAARTVAPRGISLRNLYKLENGQTRAYPSTLALLEISLRWKAGSAESILQGGEPEAVEAMAAVTLRERRVRTGIPLAEFAGRVGLSPKHYRNIEDARRRPSPEALARIAIELGCDASEIPIGDPAAA